MVRDWGVMFLVRDLEPDVSVPKGLNEGSDSTELAEVQAVYCQGYTAGRSLPSGYGMTGFIPGYAVQTKS